MVLIYLDWQVLFLWPSNTRSRRVVEGVHALVYSQFLKHHVSGVPRASVAEILFSRGEGFRATESPCSLFHSSLDLSSELANRLDSSTSPSVRDESIEPCVTVEQTAHQTNSSSLMRNVQKSNSCHEINNFLVRLHWARSINYQRLSVGGNVTSSAHNFPPS